MNVVIKSDEQKAYERQILSSFGGNAASGADREAAEVIAARTQEAVAEMRRMEGV